MDSLEIKVGQMLMLGFRGLEVRASDAIARDIRELHLGGVILFDYDVGLGSPVRNIESPDQVRELNETLQSFADVPLLVAVDQEGGEVARLKEATGFPPLPSARELGERDDPEETRRCAQRSAEALAAAGFNINFAPCVDLALNPENPIIAGKRRSYSAEPDTVVRHAREVVRVHRERGVACVLKHFPGHGSSVADTHLGFADVTETWSERELEPFETLIASGDCWAVMTAHVFNARLDRTFPATLSHRVITGLLRERCDFDGVVFSDDLEMGAISSHYGLETALFRAMEAGVDIITFANNVLYQPEIGRRSVEILKRFVKEGSLSEARLDASFRRILALKRKLGLVP